MMRSLILLSVAILGADVVLGEVRDPFPCTESTAGCNDDNPCTDDPCDPRTATCVWIPDPSNPCSDGNRCTDDRCTASGACVGTVDTANPCSDGIPCTDDHCSEAGDCVGTVDVSNLCSDGNPCTSADHCLADGACVATPEPAGTTCRPFAVASICYYTEGSCFEGQCLGADPYECPSSGSPCFYYACDDIEMTCDGPYDSGMAEVLDLRFASDGASLTWTPTEPGRCFPWYAVVSGPLGALPVGSAPAAEACAVPTSYPFALALPNPAAGEGVWYLVRTVAYDQLGRYRYGPLGRTGVGGVPSDSRSTAVCPAM
jgi:hypothetical protein